MIGLKAINYYMEPQYETANAGVPFCLLCKEDESCMSIGARIQAGVVLQYGLDISAIQKEVREWDALCTEVIKVKKEAKEAKQRQSVWDYKYPSSTSFSSVDKRVCGTLVKNDEEEVKSGIVVDWSTPIATEQKECVVAEQKECVAAEQKECVATEQKECVATEQKECVATEQKECVATEQKAREYEEKATSTTGLSWVPFSPMDAQASRNTSSIVNTSHAYHVLSSQADEDSPSHGVSGLPGGNAQMMEKDDFSDSSSSLSSENDVAVHPELSYNLSVTANGVNPSTTSYDVNSSTTSYDVNSSTTSYGVNPSTTSYDVNQSTTSYDVNQSTTSYDVNSSTTSYGVNPSTPAFSTSNLGTTPYNYTNQPTTEPNGTSL